MKKLLCSLAVVFGLFFAVGQTALAANPLSNACGVPGASSSSVCSAQQGTPIESTISKVTKIIAAVAGIAAVIMIITGGFMYVTSSGDASKITSARKTITYAVVGLIIIALAQTIIIFVINRLG